MGREATRSGRACLIAEQVKRLVLQGDVGGVSMWGAVAERFDQLQSARLNA
ncbi:MAG: DUF6961 family protein [Croceibacterium sp.]